MQLPPKVVEEGGDALGQRGPGASSSSACPLADEGRRLRQAHVVDLHAAPGLEADALLHAGGDLAQHLDAQEVAPFLGMLAAGDFLALDLPHLGHQGAGELVVAVEQVVQTRRQVADAGRAFARAPRP